MAIQFNNRIGKMRITQCRNGVQRKYDVSIWDGNCLAVFCTETKDNYYLYMFFADEQHVRKICKNSEDKPFGNDKVSAIQLNMYYSASKKVLDIFVKLGYKVRCYYKEPKVK